MSFATPDMFTNYVIDGKEIHKQTKADQIRTMNDRELAIFLKPLIGTLTEEEIFQWLQTEAQEGNKIE